MRARPSALIAVGAIAVSVTAGVTAALFGIGLDSSSVEGDDRVVHHFEIDAARWTDCPSQFESVRCGEIPLAAGDEHFEVRFTVDDGIGDALFVWLPGGPNDFSTLLYQRSRDPVRVAAGDSDVLALDPLRTTDGRWALDDCFSGQLQGEYFATMTVPTRHDVAARNLARECASSAAAGYGPSVQARVIARIAESLHPSKVDVFAGSFDAKIVPAIQATHVPVGRAVLDGPVGPSQDGLEFVRSQAQATITVARDAVKQDLPFAEQINELLARQDSDSDVYVLSALRMPEMSVPLSQIVAEDLRTSGAVRTAADKYFRRYGDGQHSALNGLYFAGVCSSMDWPSKAAYWQDLEKNFDRTDPLSQLAAVIYGYHSVCTEWPALDPVPTHNQSRPNYVILASSADSVVGTAGAHAWATRTAGDLHITHSKGHQSILAASRCTFDELFVTTLAGSCHEALQPQRRADKL